MSSRWNDQAKIDEPVGSATQCSKAKYPSVLQSLSNTTAKPTETLLPSHYDAASGFPRPTPPRYSTMDTIVEDPSSAEPTMCHHSPVDFRSKASYSSASTVVSLEVGKQVLQPALRPDITLEVEGLIGVTSYEYERYDRNVIKEKHFWSEYIIDPLATDFTRSQAPSPWTYHVHPDGGLYFFRSSSPIPILTDVYIYNPQSRTRLEDYITKIFEYINKYQILMPSDDVCLVLEFRQSGRCGYYFVDHATRCLFWLEKYDAMEFLSQVRVRYTPSLVGNEMRSLYWLHNEYFPHVRDFPSEASLELIDILVHAIGDSLTSSQNTSPYSLDDLQKMLALVKDIRNSNLNGVGSSAIIYHERLLHLHGEEAARLNIDQSIHPERQRTLLIRLLSPFLLFGPSVHLRKLQEISVDSLVRKHDWKTLQQELTEEWKEITLYATVLLNANVAFLAIQSVDSSAPLGGRSGQQRASYFSIMTSIGAIVLGLLLVRQHTTILNRVLAYRSASVWGLETLALMMTSFLIAFSIMCFGSGDAPTIFMMSVTCFTLCISCDKPFWYPWLLRRLGSKHTEGIQAGKGELQSSSSDYSESIVPQKIASVKEL
ncbi:hypothetical protein BJ912DRAFT_976800 [Pholiota molesta]|nr:hypothetical protein BJ912DRAFT_976800 [Pholiota molesta]